MSTSAGNNLPQASEFSDISFFHSPLQTISGDKTDVANRLTRGDQPYSS